MFKWDTKLGACQYKEPIIDTLVRTRTEITHTDITHIHAHHTRTPRHFDNCPVFSMSKCLISMKRGYTARVIVTLSRKPHASSSNQRLDGLPQG